MSGFSPGSTPLIDPSGTFFGPKPAGSSLLAGNFLATYGTSPTFLYSQTGAAWSVGALPGGQNGAGAAYGGTGTPKWVMMTGSQAVLTSPTGVTFTNQGNLMPAGAWVDVAWSPTLNLFAAVTAAGAVATSPDGLAWTARAAGLTGAFNIAWNARFAKFYAFQNGFNVNAGMSSPDGINWSLVTPSAASHSGYVRELGAAFGLFGLLPQSTTYCRSTDGIAFTKFNDAGGGNTNACILVAGFVYAIVGAGGAASLQRTATADLSAGWAVVTPNVIPALVGGPIACVFSAGAGLWALGAGGPNNTQILTTVNGINYTLFTPTIAVALNLNRMMVAA